MNTFEIHGHWRWVCRKCGAESATWFRDQRAALVAGYRYHDCDKQGEN